MESLLAVFNKLARNERTAAQPRPVLPSRLSALTLEGVAKAIKDGTCTRACARLFSLVRAAS